MPQKANSTVPRKPEASKSRGAEPASRETQQAASRSVSLLLLLLLLLSPGHLFLIFLLTCGPIAIARQAEALKTKYASISITLTSLLQLSWSPSPDAAQASGTHFIQMGAVLVSRCPLCYPVSPFLHPWHQVTCCLSLFILASLCLLSQLRWKGVEALSLSLSSTY